MHACSTSVILLCLSVYEGWYDLTDRIEARGGKAGEKLKSAMSKGLKNKGEGFSFKPGLKAKTDEEKLRELPGWSDEWLERLGGAANLVGGVAGLGMAATNPGTGKALYDYFTNA